MAPTVTPGTTTPSGNTTPGVWGALKYSITNVVWDATTYATGGLAISNAQLQLPNKIVFSQCEQNVPAGAAVTGGVGNAVYNAATGKLQLFNSGGTEVANATSLTGFGVQIIAWGY